MNMNISKIIAPYGKSTMPVLAHALVAMKQGRGTVTATDIETRLTVRLEQDDKIDRAFMVPIKEVAEKFKGTKGIVVTDTGLTDASGTVRCSMNGDMPPEEFPLERSMEEPVEVQIKDTTVFFDIIKQALPFAMRKSTDAFTSGITITYGEGGTDIIATDFWNMIRFRTPAVVLPENAPFKFSRQRINKNHLGGFLIPAAAAKRLPQIYDRKKPLKCVVYKQEYAVFDDGTTEFTVRLPKPGMPCYEEALRRAGCYGNEYLIIDPVVVLKDLSGFLAEHSKERVTTVLYDRTDIMTVQHVLVMEEGVPALNYGIKRIPGTRNMDRIALNGFDLERALKVQGADHIRWDSVGQVPIALKGTREGYTFDIIIMPVRF